MPSPLYQSWALERRSRCEQRGTHRSVTASHHQTGPVWFWASEDGIAVESRSPLTCHVTPQGASDGHQQLVPELRSRVEQTWPDRIPHPYLPRLSCVYICSEAHGSAGEHRALRTLDHRSRCSIGASEARQHPCPIAVSTTELGDLSSLGPPSAMKRASRAEMETRQATRDHLSALSPQTLAYVPPVRQDNAEWLMGPSLSPRGAPADFGPCSALRQRSIGALRTLS